ncbi:MAG TPA: hypothetical protein VG223_00150 [Solirubrobacteraceae bacterium]|jgi:hypothetical protein|nr:hypothetical protein [Solirubrobacteraceae bacterium]
MATAARELDFDWEDPADSRTRAPRPAPRHRTPGRRGASSRARLIRRRRTDLRQDVALAAVVALVALTVTAGLAVIVLISLPVAAALLGSIVLERRFRRRRG